jgi:peptidoglycan/LPS O-acetylase OafA/YrhL
MRRLSTQNSKIKRLPFGQAPALASPGKYVPEIDGIRGIAVLLVLAFHFELTGFKGGYLGVDAFFVVSGYLITGILLKDISEKRFSYVNFLSRRANRLLPALGVMALVTTILAWHTFSTGILSRFGDSLMGVASYTSNFVFMFDGGYFAQSTATTPLLHTWSLSVEEQFYLLFPLLILVHHATKSKFKLFLAVFLLSVISFVGYIYLLEFQSNSNWKEFAFFMLPTRAWELGAGSLLAIHVWNNKGRNVASKVWQRNGLAFSGAGFMAVSLFLGSDHSNRGIASFLMVLSVVLLIANSQQTMSGAILRNPLLLKLGLMSYGVYLYHFPIVAFSRLYQGTNELDPFEKLLALFFTMVLSALSLKFIENPIRFGILKTRTSGFMVAIFIVTLLGLAVLSKVPAQEISPEVTAADVLKNNDFTYFNDLDERLFQKSRLVSSGDDFSGDTVVVGSSRAMSLSSEVMDQSVINLSVSGATIEDIYSLGLSGLKASGQGKILIGLDPWMLNENSEETRWKSLELLYYFWRNSVNSGTSLNSLSSPESVMPPQQLSVISEIYNLANNREISQIPQDGLPEILAKKARDGSIIYGLEYRNMPNEEIAAGFSDIYSYGRMDKWKLSEVNLTETRLLISYLKQNGIDVEIVLTPYHPALYPKLASGSTGYGTAERKFIQIARQEAVKISGSYDPGKLGCKSYEFYDGMHPKEDCMVKALARTRNSP